MLVLLTIIPAAILGFFLESLLAAFGVYFALVTLADLVSHYVLKLKPSRNVDPAKLLLSECVTPEQFDAYFDTRRWIRCGSLGASCAAAGIAFLLASPLFLKAFCSVYVLSTLAGILWVRFFLKIPRPKLLHRDDRYYVPHCGPRPGHITPAQWALNKVTGFPMYGPIDHSS